MTPKKEKTSKKKSARKKTKTNVVTRVASISSRGKKGSSTSDTAQLGDVLKKNGEEHLYDTIKTLAKHVNVNVNVNPPVLFGWQNVEGFVQAIEVARAEADVPGGKPLPADPLGLPAAVTVQNFKEAVLEYARIPETSARLDTTCLPCSLAQSMQVTAELRTLDADPWIQRIIAVGVPNTLPIACVYVPRPRSNTLDRVTRQYPNSLWG